MLQDQLVQLRFIYIVVRYIRGAADNPSRNARVYLSGRPIVPAEYRRPLKFAALTLGGVYEIRRMDLRRSDYIGWCPSARGGAEH